MRKLIVSWVVFTLGLFTLVLVSTASDCGSSNTSTKPVDSGFKRKFKGVTTHNVPVYKEESEVTSAELAEVSRGFERLFSVMRFNEYKNPADTPKSWEVELQRINPKCSTPGFTMEYRATDAYDNSEFDKNPAKGVVELCVAGWLKGSTSFAGQCLPTSTKWDENGPIITGESCQKLVMLVANHPSVLAEAVYNEGEHGVLASNDLKKYWETLYHTGGRGHPILPQPDSLAPPAQSGLIDGAAELGMPNPVK